MIVRMLFRKAVLLASCSLVAVGIVLGTFGNIAHKSYLISFVASTILTAMLLLTKKAKHELFISVKRYSAGAVCLILNLACLVINGLWVLFFHPVQAADYQTFFQTAVDLSSGIHPVGKDYIAMFPHILGYSAFLSFFLRLFGRSVLVAAFVNVFLTAGIGSLLYLLSLRWAGNKIVAAVIFLFWIICPSKLLYNTMTLSEPYYTFLLLVFLLLVTTVFDKESTSTVVVILTGAAAGIALALVNSARPIGIIPIVAFVIWFLFLADRDWMRDRKKTGGLFFLFLMICFLCAGKAWNSFAEKQLEQKPPAIPGYSIYVGFNPETKGSYADEDMELLQSRYFGEYERNAKLAQESMLKSAMDRIRENKRNIPSLMIHKLKTLLGHDEGGAFYSKESMTEKYYSFWCVVSNIWYYIVCLLAAAGCVSAWKQDRSNSFCLVPLCIIGVILAQLLVEVAARYHYCLIPMLLLLGTPAYSAKGWIVDEKQ